METETVELALLPAREIDTAETAAVVNAAFARYPIYHGTRTSPEGLLAESPAGAEFLQIRRDGRLVATAMLCPATALEVDEDPFEPEHLPGSLYFGIAAVAPDAMGGGYGRRLLAETERIARERGYTRVVLSTVREFGLVEYYGPLGYEVVREVTYPAGHFDIDCEHHHCGMVKAL